MRERAMAAGVLAALVAYNAIFYFTNWPIAVHIDQAYSRLLSHVAPAAVVLIAIGYRYLVWGASPDPAGTHH